MYFSILGLVFSINFLVVTNIRRHLQRGMIYTEEKENYDVGGPAKIVEIDATNIQQKNKGNVKAAKHSKCRAQVNPNN